MASFTTVVGFVHDLMCQASSRLCLGSKLDMLQPTENSGVETAVELPMLGLLRPTCRSIKVAT